MSNKVVDFINLTLSEGSKISGYAKIINDSTAIEISLTAPDLGNLIKHRIEFNAVLPNSNMIVRNEMLRLLMALDESGYIAFSTPDMKRAMAGYVARTLYGAESSTDANAA